MRRWLATACLLWPVVAFGGFQHLQGKGGGSTLMLHYPLTSVTSGCSRLSQSITLNGTTVSPTFVYRGENATGTTWTATVGDNLTASGSPTGTGLGSPFTDGTQSWQGDGTDDYYQHPSSTTYGEPGLDDFVIEAVVRLPTSSGYRYIMSTYPRTSTGSSLVMDWTQPITNKLRIYLLEDIAKFTHYTGALTPGSWVHAILVMDRDHISGAAWYVNGSLSGPTSDPTSWQNQSIANDRKLTVGANADGGSRWDSPIACLSLWHSANWLNGQTDVAALAASRYKTLVGTDAINARGPTVTVTSSGPPVCHRPGDDDSWARPSMPNMLCIDDGGSAGAGGRFNDSVTNSLTYSDQLDAANWTETGTAVVSADNATDPAGLMNADTITDDDAANAEYVSQSVTVANDSTTWTCSAWLRDDAAHSALLDVDLTGGTTPMDCGADQSVTATWDRYSVSCANNSTGNVTLTVGLYATTATATETGTVEAWGVECINESSGRWYVWTSTAAATGTETYATVDQGEGVAWIEAAGTIEVTTTLDFYTGNVAASWMIFQTASNRVTLWHYPSTPTTYAGGRLAGSWLWYISLGAFGVPTSHTDRVAWDASGVEAWRDGVSKGTDVDTFPDLTGATLYIGTQSSSYRPLDGWLKDFKVWRRRVSP